VGTVEEGAYILQCTNCCQALFILYIFRATIFYSQRNKTILLYNTQGVTCSCIYRLCEDGQ